jgi:CheY-like chemotaxis protein/HPt (histidine-containing phosphotransfer) domain-containing protein
VYVESPALSLPRVLLVEDHAINRDMIARQLAFLGCQVAVAEDGMQACVAVMKDRFDVILMDCQMPRVDGYQAARAIREHERSHTLQRVPIIAVTASLLPNDRDRGIACGMDDFLLKPTPVGELRQVLERFTNLPLARTVGPRAASGTIQIEPKSAEQVMDVGALAALRSLRRPGRPNLVVQLITEYLESSPARIERLLTEMRSSGPSKGDIAHGLKSISATLGAAALAQTLARIESAQRAGARSRVSAEFEPLQRQYSEACAALERILAAERQIEGGSA